VHVIGFSLCLMDSLSKLFQPNLIVGVEADSAFNVPDGNDLQIARVF